MAAPWDDTEFWIEDRGRRGAHLLRGPAGSAGYWTCPNGGWTYVLPIGAPINTPPPPRRAGTAAQAQPQNPTPVDTGRGTTPTATTPTTNTRGNTGRNNFDAQSTDSSTDSRHWESPTFRADTARHQNFVNDRFCDEPVWNARGRPRNDPRGHSTREHTEDRVMRSERAYDEDAIRARDIRAICARPYSTTGRRDERRSDDNRFEDRRPDRVEERRSDRADDRRPSSGTAPRIIAKPNPHIAPRRADGHPLAPRAAARDHEDELLPDPQYVAREEERLPVARARAKASQDRARNIAPIVRPRDERGMWRTFHIGTIAQAVNLCEWLELGESDAYEKFQHVVQSCAASPTDFRAEGEAYLLRHQQQLERSYWPGEAAGPSRSDVTDVNALMDDITPQERAPRKGKARADGEDTAPRWSFGSVAPLVPSHTGTPPPMANDEVAVHVDGPGYFGTSAPDPTDTVPEPAPTGDFRVWHGLPNSRATVLEVIRHYEFAPTNMWTMGMSRPNPATPAPTGIHASSHTPMEIEPTGFQITPGVPGVLLINDPVPAPLPAPPPETLESDGNDTDAEAESG
ncbi:hypothetical protein C8R47DRAFT_1210456 [Mycena vitilis]|nr:hypothetical protein C8R47DRAFT_1210456 [Mycena vitilis]